MLYFNSKLTTYNTRSIFTQVLQFVLSSIFMRHIPAN